VIALRFKPQSTWRRCRSEEAAALKVVAGRPYVLPPRRMSGLNAVEICDVFLRLQEARDPLEAGAMPFRDGGRVLDVAAVADLGGVRITLQQEGLWSCAAGTPNADQNEK
jgi:hypothetical protein